MASCSTIKTLVLLRPRAMRLRAQTSSSKFSASSCKLASPLISCVSQFFFQAFTILLGCTTLQVRCRGVGEPVVWAFVRLQACGLPGWRLEWQRPLLSKNRRAGHADLQTHHLKHFPVCFQLDERRLRVAAQSQHRQSPRPWFCVRLVSAHVCVNCRCCVRGGGLVAASYGCRCLECILGPTQPPHCCCTFLRILSTERHAYEVRVRICRWECGAFHSGFSQF